DATVGSERIWAPWRLEYVKDAAKDVEDECIFCAKPADEDDEANLIVHRGGRCFVILNKYPYTNGHLMVAPFEHLATIQELDAATVGELMALAQRAMSVLEDEYSPHGYNVLDAGMIATEMLYFLVGSRELDGGAMVTASHNPKAWTGLKLVREGALALSGETGIAQVQAMIEAGLPDPPGGGVASEVDIY